MSSSDSHRLQIISCVRASSPQPNMSPRLLRPYRGWSTPPRDENLVGCREVMFRVRPPLCRSRVGDMLSIDHMETDLRCSKRHTFMTPDACLFRIDLDLDCDWFRFRKTCKKVALRCFSPWIRTNVRCRILRSLWVPRALEDECIAMALVGRRFFILLNLMIILANWIR